MKIQRWIFVSFSTVDQHYFNVDPQRSSDVDLTLKCWIGLVFAIPEESTLFSSLSLERVCLLHKLMTFARSFPSSVFMGNACYSPRKMLHNNYMQLIHYLLRQVHNYKSVIYYHSYRFNVKSNICQNICFDKNIESTSYWIWQVFIYSNNNSNIFRFSRGVIAWIYLALCSKELKKLWPRYKIQKSKLFEEVN